MRHSEQGFFALSENCHLYKTASIERAPVAVEKMDTDENHHFELELNNVFRSLAGYSTNENGEKQLRFDPPVYTQRYSTVLNILSHERWKDEIKKVPRR